MKEKSKTIVVGDSSYQLTKWDPRTAVWVRDVLLLAQLEKISQIAPGAPQEASEDAPDPAQMARLLWAIGGPLLKHDQYAEIQNAALRSAGRVEGATTVPLVHSNGSIFPQEPIAFDAVAVEKLVSESIMFNLSPFFEQAAASNQPQAGR